MKIANLNRMPSTINFQDEALCMYPYTLLAERFYLASSISIEILYYCNIDNFSDDFVLDECLILTLDNPQAQEMYKDIKQKNQFVKKLSQQKNKDRNALNLIGLQRGFMKVVRKTLKTEYVNRLEAIKIFELIEFAEEKCWEIIYPLVNIKDNQEDVYIPALTYAIINNEYILAFGTHVEEIFKPKLIHTPTHQPFDFIKIPLWDFPLFEGIKFKQMKHAQQDLKPALREFTQGLEELKKQLAQLPFTAQNYAEIEDLCQQKIMANAQPVQKAIDNSLYLNQLRNQTPSNTGMKFHFGITTAENIANYFGRTSTIEPYVLSEIKEQLSRHINLQATYIFSYCTIQKPEEEQK